MYKKLNLFIHGTMLFVAVVMSSNVLGQSEEKKEKIAKLIEQDTKRPMPNEPKTRPTKP